MAFKNISSYKDASKYRSFPSETGELHKKKDQDWAEAYLSSMLHKYMNHYGTEMRYNWQHLNELEKYAKGTQGNRKVKEKLLRFDKDTGKFKGRMKDVFQTLDILPEMIDVIISNNMKADYKAQSVAVDEMSINDKNIEINTAKFLVEERTKSFLKFMGIKPQSNLTPEELETFTASQIDILYNTGGIQLQRERASVSVCNTAMMYSGHKEIENKTSFDSIVYGICATKSYWDYIENVPKYRYVDPKNLIVPSSKYNDFRDKTFCAEIRLMRLNEILSESPDITGEKLRELILCNTDFNGDFPALRADLDYYLEGKNDIFDEYRIAVLDAQWLATDEEKYLQSRTSGGFDIYKKTDKDFRIKKSDADKGKSLNRQSVIRKYEAKWVIGTNIFLNFGLAANVKYKGSRGARIPVLDYNISKTGGKSLVDRSRTLVDDINLAICKLRSAIASMPPAPRMVVYEHALQNIKFNNILQKPSDLIAGLSEDGVLIVNGRDTKGNFINNKAVEFITSGIAEDVTIFSNEVIQKIGLLRQVLGLPEGLDGTAGQKYQLASTMNLAAAASSNALFPTLSLIGNLYEQTFNNAIIMTQAMCNHTEISVKEIGMSDNVVNMFKLTKDFSNYEFRIKVYLAPTEAERELLMQKVSEMNLAYVQSNGTIGCSQAEFFMLYKLIKAGLLDEAMSRIAIIEEQRNKANIQIQQANIEANAKQQQDSAAMAEQAKRETVTLAEAEKRQTKMMEIMAEGITSMQKLLLSDTPENRVDSSKGEQLINENKAYVSNIVSQDQQVLNPQDQVPQEQIEEGIPV